ncbi:sec-independent protein translocase protein TatA [Halogranum gelatinilyticum]|uniref:Sec-independent protein translocase protein TatA n=1 Tax=Halogranum gelatinilyticum TaxID=660521 RepID=A0A1G9R4N4_9EURY|nr:twin-arginine translocase TatA/TatE family subunit [Halogranum gelatinilyticum]SDM18081.1 sec-independent protein translocase protein TatA [Halogranum gelatinilyticum]
MLTLIPLFGPIPGGPELIIILAVIVLLFGANKIPKLARASGQAMGEFRRGREEIEQEIKSAATSVETDAADEQTAVVDDLSTDRSTERAA